ncbi:lipoyl(octanoyl) transferase LipB [Jiella sonneratiae]|nr:lipoyl(octanoyl) transferase LipB [Jiella sonneratiae]
MDSPIAPSPRLDAATTRFLATPGSPPVEWLTLDGLTDYETALAAMEARAAAIADGSAPEAVLCLEHPPLYTAGTGAKADDLLDSRFPVFAAGRGGQYTYHGPGQRVAYVMLDLRRRRQDVRAFVAALEAWIIATLADFQVTGERREDRVGVWVRRPERPAAPDGSVAEDKIAAIGIRVRRWVTFHGISLNVDPDLSHFSGIVPCGIRGHGVTSLGDLGILVSLPEVDGLLRKNFEAVFGETREFAESTTLG